MSKSNNGNKGASKPAKKGLVVNRRHNRTVSQDVAKSDPKWENVGQGIFKRKGPGNKTAYIGHKGGKLTSLTRKSVEVALAPKDAPEEIAQAAE